MKGVFSRLYKNRFTFFLIYIELVIAICFISIEIDDLYQISYNEIRATSFFDVGLEKIIGIEYDTVLNENNIAKCKDEIKTELYDTGKIENVINYSNGEEQNFFMHKYRENTDPVFLYIDNISEKEYYKYISFDDDINKIKQINIVEGRNFCKEDLNSDDIPIIVGEEFAKKNNIIVGDNYFSSFSVEYDNMKEKFTVVGIMKNDIKFPYGDFTDSDVGEYELSNNLVLIPYSDVNCDLYSNIGTYQYIIVKNGSDNEEIKKIVKSVAKRNNVKINVDVLDSKLNNTINKELNDSRWWICLSTCILLFAFISVSMIISASIYKRKYELGIKYALGYSKKRIIVHCVEEILVVIIVALITDYIILECLLGARIYEAFVNKEMFLIKSYVVTFFVNAIFCVIPIISISFSFRKIRLNELVNRK